MAFIFISETAYHDLFSSPGRKNMVPLYRKNSGIEAFYLFP